MNKYLFCVFMLFPLLLNAGAKKDLKLGNKAYNQGKYGAAYEYYKKAAASGEEEGVYNSGAALYRLKDYEASSKEYLQAAKDYETQDTKLAQDSYYNAASAQYMNKQTKEALSSERKAILLNAKDEAAIHNMQFMLEEQKKNNQDQQNKQGDKNSRQDKQENSQDQSNQGNNQEEQNQDKQQQQEQEQQQDRQDKLDQQQAQDILKMLGENEKKNNPPPLQGNTGNDKDGQSQVEKDW